MAMLTNRPNSAVSTARFAVNGTGRSSLPTTFPALSNATTVAGIAFWVAVD
jgi:hypothetical protein